MNSVVIDGVTYRPEAKSSEVRIVILQRGWVVVGRWSRDGDMCSLEQAAVIRTWGTTKGLGELVGGPTSLTKLDPAGHVEFHILTVVATLDADEDAWAIHLR